MLGVTCLYLYVKVRNALPASYRRAMQLLQNTPGFVEVRVVRGGEYRSQDELEIRTKMEAAAAGGLKTTFSYVDEIPRTRRGKHRFLIQGIQSGT